MKEWFSVNGLVFSTEKTNIAKFIQSYCQNELFQITYQYKVIAGTDNIKFIGLELDMNINWKNHDYKFCLKQVVSATLLESCIHNTTTLKMICLPIFMQKCSMMSYFRETR
jgi:hypothetical protein